MTPLPNMRQHFATRRPDAEIEAQSRQALDSKHLGGAGFPTTPAAAPPSRETTNETFANTTKKTQEGRREVLGLYRCPGCKAVFGRQDMLDAHFAAWPTCRGTADYVMIRDGAKGVTK